MASDPSKPSLDQVPKFDSRSFEPPAWANGPQFQWGREDAGNADAGPSKGNQDKDQQIKVMLEKLGAGLTGAEGGFGDDNADEDEDEDEDEEWEDASEGEDDAFGDDAEAKADFLKFTTEELKKLLDKATEFKTRGNAAFTSKPPDLEQALVFYNEAIDGLPNIPKQESASTVKPKPEPESGLQEVTEEEATVIENAKTSEEVEVENEEVTQRREIEDEIRDCQKAVWGNIGACHVSLRDDKEAVKACTKALEIDPNYVKALQRRAAANERLSTWTSLTQAQEDYQKLLTILPRTSPVLAQVNTSLRTLPAKISIQQEKEKDEMLSKLKELGNGLLGKFGLSTDMFKFEQQPGGGYGMKFEK